MDILELIKKRASIRKYQDKPIPKKILDKIIEAGIWGPSVPSFLRIQPWKFVVVTDKDKIGAISDIILKKAQTSGAGVNILLKTAADIVGSSANLIAVYNSGDLSKIQNKYGELYDNFKLVIERAEISAISAAIQKMVLTAEGLKIGTCWLDMPLFCEEAINALLGCNERLFAFLTLGYPAEEGRRSPRKPLSESVRYTT